MATDDDRNNEGAAAAAGDGGELWHAADERQLVERLGVDTDRGLSGDEAARRLQEHGPNVLAAEEGISPVHLILKQIRQPIIYLLFGAAAASAVTGHPVDAAAIGGVILLNTLLGFIQEYRAERALEALHKMTAPHASVLRDGRAETIEAREVVPGDILLLDTGDRIPADARLLSGEEIQADESALTGESRPAKKRPGIVAEDVPLADRWNMVWMSSPVVHGNGRAVTVATGMRTEMGEIAGRVRGQQREDTPLQRRLGRLGLFLAVAAIVLAAGVFFLGLARGYETMEMVLFAVAVAVSAIPEGLPAAISVTLAVGVQRMAARNAIIRRMPAVETLGSTTVICSDKTGTITRNEMTVTRVWLDGETYEVSGLGYEPSGHITRAGPEEEAGGEALDVLLTIGALTNNARLEQDDGNWSVEGTPTEGAILVASAKGGKDYEQLRSQRPRKGEIAFSSDRRYMATLHDDEGQGRDGGSVVYVKGAPERLLEFCDTILHEGRPVELDRQWRERVEKANEELAGQALRVMACGYRRLDSAAGGAKLSQDQATSGLTLVGLWGMLDPPREEAVQAAEDAKTAGIHLVMITGDHAATATAIARQAGFSRPGVVADEGRQVENMSNQDVARSALEKGVFARVSPAHKVKIMQSLKEAGQIVAMTGDGVNDAPALKGADIGVAMGQSGTEVAKEAADMVLTDDNFATIVHAVEEGRIIYNNLRRVVFYLLTTNLGEVLTLTAALVIGLDLPLTAVMILWINLVTDGACTVPLGLEPKHGNVLDQPPRDPKSNIIDAAMLRGIVLLSPVIAIGTLGMFRHYSQNYDPAYARTVAFTTLAAFEWCRALSTRSTSRSIFTFNFFGNRWLLVGLTIAILLQLAAIYSSPGHAIFGTVSLAAGDWLRIIAVALSIIVVDEILKLLHVHDQRPRSARKKNSDP